MELNKNDVHLRFDFGAATGAHMRNPTKTSACTHFIKVTAQKQLNKHLGLMKPKCFNTTKTK